MPGPSADSVIRARWFAGIVFKACAAVLLITAISWSAVRVQPFRYQAQMAARGFAPDPGLLDANYFGVPAAISAAAVALLLVNRFAMRWIVTIPRPLCPRCGYDLSKPTSTQCPECGLELHSVDANDQSP